jgi:hypothetical protein
MAAGNREVGSDGELFVAAGSEQGTIVADAESEGCAGRPAGSGANLVDQVQLAGLASLAIGICRRRWHTLRIGQTGGCKRLRSQLQKSLP